MKLTLILILIFPQYLYAEDINFHYKNGNVIVKNNGSTFLSIPYAFHPSVLGGIKSGKIKIDRYLKSNKSIYNIGKCIIVNRKKPDLGEPHAQPEGKATLYNLNGQVVEIYPYRPIDGAIAESNSKKWGIVLFEAEGQLTHYIHISESCKITNKNFQINNTDAYFKIRGKFQKAHEKIIVRARYVSLYENDPNAGYYLIKILKNGTNTIEREKIL